MIEQVRDYVWAAWLLIATASFVWAVWPYLTVQVKRRGRRRHPSARRT
jgi:hypothetical protein